MKAEQIVKALGGRRAGAGWQARCPAHDDSEPSLSIGETDDGKVLIYCHAGCEQHDVIDRLRERHLWNAPSPKARRHAIKPKKREPLADDKRAVLAKGIWQATRPALGTLAETYLRGRGLTLPLPQTLRFHIGLRHRSGASWPAMVALVTRGVDEKPIAVHRTFIARDGEGKAPVEPTKMMLGPCRGGVVRLGTPGNVLLVGEGIETCLAAMQETGHAAWAALSTSGLRTLELPRHFRSVIVLADGDAPGEAAAQDCAQRWKREGRRVRIARPPQGTDFNDLLISRTLSIAEDAR